MKRALIAATLILLGGTVAGCGSDDSGATSSTGSSSSASPSATDIASGDMCAALTSGGAIKNGKDIAALAGRLKSTGTPTGITAEARKGFDLYLGVLEGIDEGTTAKELKKMDDLGLTTAQEAKVEAFFTYATTACADTSGTATEGAS